MAVGSLFDGLSLGLASVVVPIFGSSSSTAACSARWWRVAGLLLCLVGTYLVAR